jgi:hypothetical protein
MPPDAPPPPGGDQGAPRAPAPSPAPPAPASREEAIIAAVSGRMDAMLDAWGVVDPDARAARRARLHARLMERVAPAAAAAAAAAEAGAGAGVSAGAGPAGAPQPAPQPSLSAPAALPRADAAARPQQARPQCSAGARPCSSGGPAVALLRALTVDAADSPRASVATHGSGQAPSRSAPAEPAGPASASAGGAGGRGAREDAAAAAVHLLLLAEPGAKGGDPVASAGPLQPQAPHHGHAPPPDDDGGAAAQSQLFKRRLFPRSKLLSQRSTQLEGTPPPQQQAAARRGSKKQQKAAAAAAAAAPAAPVAPHEAPQPMLALQQLAAAGAPLPLPLLQEQLVLHQQQQQLALPLLPPGLAVPLALPPQPQPQAAPWDASAGGGGSSTSETVNQLLQAAALLLSQQQAPGAPAALPLGTAAPLPPPLAAVASADASTLATHLLAPQLSMRQQSLDAGPSLSALSCMGDTNGVSLSALPPLLLRSVSDRSSFSSGGANSFAAALLSTPLSPRAAPAAPARASMGPPAPHAARAASSAPAPPRGPGGSDDVPQAALARACQARLALQSLLDDDSMAGERGRAFLPHSVAASLNQAVLLLDSHLLHVFSERAANGGDKGAAPPRA